MVAVTFHPKNIEATADVFQKCTALKSEDVLRDDVIVPRTYTLEYQSYTVELMTFQH